MAAKPLELHTDLSDDDFFKFLNASGKYKERSNRTHDTVHAPLLAHQPSKPIWCLLLGDSMLERLKTTGAHSQIARVRHPDVFNAGVGGDRIENVLYRLGTKDLFHGLQLQGMKHAILQIGTNDLRPKRGLTSEALQQYALVLETMHRAAPGVKILVTGLMPRKDVGQPLIDHSNLHLEELVREFNQATGQTSVRYMPPHPTINSSHLVDHVHLNADGYKLFAEEMWSKLKEMEG